MNDTRFPHVARESRAFRNIIGQLPDDDLASSSSSSVSGALGQVQLTLNGSDLQLAAYKGNGLTFADGTNATISSALTLSASGASATTLYYIYATYSGTTVNAIEKSTTSYATTNGIFHMSGNTAKAFVGMARTNGSSAWTDSYTQRFVRSHFNDPGYPLWGSVHGGTRTVASWAETSSSARIEFVALPNEVIEIYLWVNQRNDTAGGYTRSSIGIDGTTPINSGGSDINAMNYSNSANDIHSGLVHYVEKFSAGYHYATCLIYGSAGGSTAQQYEGRLTGILRGSA